MRNKVLGGVGERYMRGCLCVERVVRGGRERGVI